MLQEEPGPSSGASHSPSLLHEDRFNPSSSQPPLWGGLGQDGQQEPPSPGAELCHLFASTSGSPSPWLLCGDAMDPKVLCSAPRYCEQENERFDGRGMLLARRTSVPKGWVMRGTHQPCHRSKGSSGSLEPGQAAGPLSDPSHPALGLPAEPTGIPQCLRFVPSPPEAAARPAEQQDGTSLVPPAGKPGLLLAAGDGRTDGQTFSAVLFKHWQDVLANYIDINYMK